MKPDIPAERPAAMNKVPALVGMLGLWVAAWVLTAGPVSAASFDCRKAAAPYEKAVCASPSLSSNDEKLAQMYAGVLKQLSPAHQALVRRDQADWAKSRQACRDPAAGGMDACLEGKYAERIKELENSVQTIGGTRFLMIERSYDAPIETPDEEPYAFVTITTPHPDGSSLPAATRAWIERTDAEVEARFRGARDTEVTVSVERLRPDLVTLKIATTVLGHLAAHPFYNWEYRHYLPKLGRALRAQDLFRPGAAWAAKLTAAVKAALGTVETKDLPTVETLAVDPTLWSFDSTGLTVDFNPPIDPATVPWATLEPLLATPMPFDRTTLQPLPPDPLRPQ